MPLPTSTTHPTGGGTWEKVPAIARGDLCFSFCTVSWNWNWSTPTSVSSMWVDFLHYSWMSSPTRASWEEASWKGSRRSNQVPEKMHCSLAGIRISHLKVNHPRRAKSDGTWTFRAGVLEDDGSGLVHQLCHFPPVWPWANHLAFLSLFLWL